MGSHGIASNSNKELQIPGKKNILLYGSFLRQHNFQIIFLIHKRWQWAVGWNPAVATCRMIRLTNNEEKKILRITSEWKVDHLEYYLNGFADYIR